jgi:hypothetical protein
VLVGDFRIDGLSRMDDLNEVLCRMSLDVEGILHVSAIEKRTGKSKQITISNALRTKSEADLQAARRRLEEMFSTRAELEMEGEEIAAPELPDQAIDAIAEVELETEHTNGKAVPVDANWTTLRHEAVELLERSGGLLDRMHAEDREEAVGLRNVIESAVARHDSRALGEAVRSLKELLFFVEGA